MPRDSRFARRVFRTAGAVAAAGAVDLVLAALFLAAFRATRNPGP